MTDDSGRIRAANVTGPMGAYVQGAPYRRRDDFGSNDGGGFGSGNDGGY